MCGYRELFSDLDETKQGLVTFGDTTKVPFKGKGSIPIKLKNGDSSYIANVYYVPAIKQNLISLGQLVERVERNTREKERVCIVSFSSCCKLFVLEIKQCVLSPPSVSKPPPVVSPTNSTTPSTRNTESGNTNGWQPWNRIISIIRGP
jgi:hypothetical protein